MVTALDIDVLCIVLNYVLIHYQSLDPLNGILHFKPVVVLFAV